MGCNLRADARKLHPMYSCTAEIPIEPYFDLANHDILPGQWGKMILPQPGIIRDNKKYL